MGSEKPCAKRRPCWCPMVTIPFVPIKEWTWTGCNFFPAPRGPKERRMSPVILCKTSCFGWVTKLSSIFATNVTSRCLLWASFGLKVFSIYHSTWICTLSDVHAIKQVVRYPSAMFSALKKWAKGGNEDSKISTPLGVRAMGQALQRKFARGVQYNSKFFFFSS